MRNLKGCKIAVFDMDNCIIDDRHRQHLIDMSAPMSLRYKRYHEAMADDRPFAFGATLIKLLTEYGWLIVVNTARPREYEDQTIYQITQMGVREQSLVATLMRDKEDFGIPSGELKPAKLDKFIREHEIEGCEMVTFDDRPDVVRAYHNLFGTNHRTHHHLLTGSTLISFNDVQSMSAAANAFSGKAIGINPNAIPASIHEKYKAAQSFFVSEMARRWLDNRFPFFRAEIKQARDWQMSDFPGAEVYNAKRSDNECSTRKYEDFVAFDPAKPGTEETVFSSVFSDLVKDVAAIYNVPVRLLTGEPLNGNCRCVATPLKEKPLKQRTAADVLAEMADTFRERNAVYKDNAEKVGEVMAVLFPDGVTLKTAADHKFYHLFELLIVKLTRFTNSGLKHEDSVHDLTVYGAMLEAIGVMNHNIKTGASEDKDD